MPRTKKGASDTKRPGRRHPLTRQQAPQVLGAALQMCIDAGFMVAAKNEDGGTSFRVTGMTTDFTTTPPTVRPLPTGDRRPRHGKPGCTTMPDGDVPPCTTTPELAPEDLGGTCTTKVSEVGGTPSISEDGTGGSCAPSPAGPANSWGEGAVEPDAFPAPAPCPAADK